LKHTFVTYFQSARCFTVLFCVDACLHCHPGIIDEGRRLLQFCHPTSCSVFISNAGEL